jgi:hypothetical protein
MTQVEVRQVWEGRIAAYQASGQSASEWCAMHQLLPRQLWYWLRKFKTTKASVTLSSQWMAINVDKRFEEKETSLLVRIGSAEIEVKSGYNPALLSDVVRTLQTLC